MDKRRRGNDVSFFTDDEAQFIHNCWCFLNAMARFDNGVLPQKTETQYSPLEAYLILGYAMSQAGIFRMSNMGFGDAGVFFIFPGTSSMREVSQDQWDLFAQRNETLRHKIAAH